MNPALSNSQPKNREETRKGGVKSITLLGSTGSVGVNTLEVVRRYPAAFRVAGFAIRSNGALLKEQIGEFSPKAVFVKNAEAVAGISKAYGKKVKIFTEREGIEAFSGFLDSDIVVAATSGTGALSAVIHALEKGKRVALANKEILVAAGALVMSKLKKNPKASLVPVDSEHSAIFQCLEGALPGSIRKIILTGSGGPLREITEEKFLKISKEAVINHPKWKMGKKISVDSATLMNKGMEIIEASWLFGVPIERIEVLIHPEAVIHSMVEFQDGAVLAQLGVTDMRLPIQYALSYPERLSMPASLRLDFSKISSLNFSQPDRKKFPCLDLAYQAAKRSGSAPCVLSAADEVAVGAYLNDRIGFVEIPGIIEKVLSHHRHVADPDLSEIQSIQRWAAEETEKLCKAC